MSEKIKFVEDDITFWISPLPGKKKCNFMTVDFVVKLNRDSFSEMRNIRTKFYKMQTEFCNNYKNDYLKRIKDTFFVLHINEIERKAETKLTLPIEIDFFVEEGVADYNEIKKVLKDILKYNFFDYIRQFQ
jgi:hypothetical protein